MRHRLIELINKLRIANKISLTDIDTKTLVNSILADGWIRLPCKEGDTVYCIIPKCNAPYIYCPYDGGYGTSRCGKNPCEAYIKESKFALSDLENIGKTVFLTREQAERALAERQENDG